MREISLQLLTDALHNSWPVWEHEPPEGYWSAKNPARGQCVPSSLVVQDYFGGDITRVRAKGEVIDETHYFNILDNGTIIDTTRSQYTAPVVLEPAPVDLEKYNVDSVRERLLSESGTLARYQLLKNRVAAYINKANA